MSTGTETMVTTQVYRVYIDDPRGDLGRDHHRGGPNGTGTAVAPVGPALNRGRPTGVSRATR
jgi:hypothetical protein